MAFLDMLNISKTYPGVKALSQVGLEVRLGKSMQWQAKMALAKAPL